MKFSVEPRTRYRNDTPRGVRLSVATPVHSDISGECFGMTVIEADDLKHAIEVLTGLGTVDCEIFVADDKLQSPDLPAHVLRNVTDDAMAEDMDGLHVPVCGKRCGNLTISGHLLTYESFTCKLDETARPDAGGCSMSKLQRGLKKRNPFASPQQEAVLNILRTSDLIDNRLGRLFRQFGLTSSQYNVLRILRGEGKSLPSLEIADRMIQVVPAITGLIDRLEKQKLVVRQRCHEDRRVVYVAITRKALDLLGQVDEPLDRLQRKLVGGLAAAELSALSRLLEKARSAAPPD